MLYNHLSITSLTPEQKARTCGYWYLVQDQCSPHTAFETRVAALTWLSALKLTIPELLEEEGIFQTQNIIGAYSRDCIMCDKTTWDLLPGIPMAILENGSYRYGKLSEDIDGRRRLIALNCNSKWAAEIDYDTCRKFKRQGITIF